MSDCEVMVKRVGEKLYSYLERNPSEYDVTFSVGPEKEEVKALKIILKASSSVFEQEFNDKWENAVLKEERGIPLPDLNAAAFKIFIQLLISDTWSVEALKSMKLAPNEMFSLLAICEKFQIPEALKATKELMTDDFLKDFGSFLDSEEFLNLSKAHLEFCVKSNHAIGKEADIFEAVCKWAEFRCKNKQVEPTAANIREELGSILFEVRFPLMSVADLTNIRLKNILTADERLALFDFITRNNDTLNINVAHFPFNTHPRGLQQYLSLDLAQKLQVVEDPPFVCDGKQLFLHRFQPKKKVVVYGLGFLGPIDANAFYKVDVQTVTARDSRQTCENISKICTKNVLARKGKIFYFMLDDPITWDPLGDDGWNSWHVIRYWLKGPNTMGIELPPGDRVSLCTGELQLKLWYRSRQLVEILCNTV